MSEILAQWLGAVFEGRISFEATNLGRLFSNGFLFGELLLRLGVSLDHDQLQHSSSLDAKVWNFSVLHPILAKAFNISLSNRLANEIMTEQRGAAEHLLLQIKTCFQSDDKESPSANKSSPRAQKKTVTGDVEDIPAIMQKIRHAAPKFLEDHSNPSMRKYVDKGKLNQEMAAKFEQEEEVVKAQLRDERRQKILQSLDETRKFARSWDENIHKDCIDAEKQKIERDKSLLRVKFIHDREIEKQKQRNKEHLIQEMEGEIEGFEKTLKRIVADDQEEVVESVAIAQARNAYDHIEDLKKKLPAPKEMAADTEAYLEKVKERKHVETIARQEREKRRRKIMLEQIKAQGDLEKKGMEENLLSRLLRISSFERADTAKRLQDKRYKDTMMNNRQYRNQQYAEQKATERKLNLEHDSVLGKQIREENKEFMQLEHQRFMEAELMRSAARFRKHYDTCRKVVNQVVDLSLKVVEHKETVGATIPVTTIRGWLETFVAGAALFPVAVTRQMIAAPVENMEVPDPTEFEHYMNHRNEWIVDDIKEPNQSLLSIVQEIEDVVNPPPKLPDPPKPPPFPVKAMVVGKSFSGKTTVASHLAYEYVLERITLESLTAETLKIAEISDKGSPSTPELESHSPERIKVAQQFVKEMSGNSLTDQTLIAALYTKIQLIEADKSKGGWILDGIIQTAAQARLLERFLTGADSGDDKKKGKKAPKADAQPPAKAGAKKAKPVPGGPPMAPTTPTISGFDMVIKVESSLEVALLRSKNRLRDPHTGIVYHSILNPAPPEVTGRLETLSDFDEKALVDQLSSQTTEDSAIWDLFSRFGNIHTIEGAEPLTDVLAHGKRIVEEFLAKKKVEAEETAALGLDIKAETLEVNQSQPLSTLPSTVMVASLSINPIAEPPPVNKIALDFALTLKEKWQFNQDNFQIDMMDRLNRIHKGRESFYQHLGQLKKEFVTYLQRPNPVGEIVFLFEKDFNSIPENQRSKREIIQLLRNQTEKLQDELWESAERRKEELDQEGEKMLHSGWFEDYIQRATDDYTNLMQYETNLYLSTLNFVDSYFLAKNQKPAREHVLHPAFDVFAGNYKHENGLKIQDRSKADISAPHLAGDARGGQSLNVNSEEHQAYLSHRSSARNSISTASDVASAVPSKVHSQGQFSKSIYQLKEARDNVFTIISTVVEDPVQKEIVDYESQVFGQKIDLIVSVGLQIFEAIKSIWDETKEKFAVWSGKRYVEDMNIARKMIHIIHTSIDGCNPLPSSFVLEAPQVDIPESEFHLEVKDNVSAHEPVLEDPDRFTTAQLARLSQHIRTIAPSGVLKTSDFVSLTFRLANSANGMDTFPLKWCRLTKDVLIAVAAVMDPFKTGYMDWREFFVSMLLPSLPTSSELYNLKLELMGLDPLETGMIDESSFQKIKMWFETKDSPTAQELYSNIKDLLFFLFQDPSSDGIGRIDYIRFLMYLSLDTEPMKGLKKVFCMISKEGDEAITANQLHQILHRSTILNQSPPSYYTIEVFERSVVEAALPSEGSLFTLDALLANEKSRLIIEKCTYYQHKDLYSAVDVASASFAK
eukprot:TRINITY_DN7494_c0_g2_i1.p1 TRINITY_DN7494_c0_g2~~TRINITY_DN7494_c0_g2_i1.p1  ORF type:complete len:1562 (+),score=435.65 TRINITY_DN7494_c0_g2_i1:43-4728(+)